MNVNKTVNIFFRVVSIRHFWEWIHYNITYIILYTQGIIYASGLSHSKNLSKTSVVKLKLFI